MTQSVLGQATSFSEWGTYHDPSKSSVFGLSEDSLSIYTTGPKQDLSIELGNMTAPRVITKVNGDFEIEVRVDGNFAPGKTKVSSRKPYQGAGILMMQDKSNYIRLEYAYLNDGVLDKNYVSYEIRLNGKITTQINSSISQFQKRSSYIDLKLSKSKNRINASIRIDGRQWRSIPAHPAFQLPDDLEVGFAVVNASTTPVAVHFTNAWIKDHKIDRNTYRTILKIPN